MEEIILTYVIGIAVIVIGILNMCGNVKMLHSYHRKHALFGLLQLVLPLRFYPNDTAYISSRK